MKTALFISVFLMSVTGCAVGSSDPTGDENLGTDQGGEAVGQPTAGSATSSEPSTNAKTQGSYAHTNQFDPTPQIIPNRQGHTPTAPDPGPVRIGPVVPR